MPGLHVPLSAIPWRLYCKPRLIAGGPLAGNFVLVVDRRKAAVAALSGAALSVPAALGGGTYTVPDLSAAAAPTADHDGDEEDVP